MSQVISVVLRMCTQIEVDRKGVHASGELGIAQPVKGKYENRVLSPRTYLRMPGLVACAYNPSTGEAGKEQCPEAHWPGHLA